MGLSKVHTEHVAFMGSVPNFGLDVATHKLIKAQKNTFWGRLVKTFRSSFYHQDSTLQLLKQKQRF
jgi:hypothetical protein